MVTKQVEKICEHISEAMLAGVIGKYSFDPDKRKEVNGNFGNDLIFTSYGRDRVTPQRRSIAQQIGGYGLYYILSGSGSVEHGCLKQKLKKGSLFVASYEKKLTLTADENYFLDYLYFDFSGLCQKSVIERMGLSEDIVRDTGKDIALKEAVIHLYDSFMLAGIYSLKTLGLFYLLIDRIAYGENYRSTEKPAERYVKQALNFIGNNFQHTDVYEIANHCGVSLTYLDKVFRKVLDCSPKDFLTVYKLKTAESYLYNTDIPISKICLYSGYYSSQYFIRMFKRYFGVTPSQYRKRKGESNAEG